MALVYTSQYPTQDDDHVKSTTKYSTNYWAYFATDPAKPLTGTSSGNSWLSALNEITNQRFHIDLGSAKVIRRIYYENLHSSGVDTDRGVQNFTFWGSNTGAGTFDDLVYVNDEGWTQLTISQSTFDQHSAANEADPKFIVVTNSTAYRYYAFKCADGYGTAELIGVRRIELQILSRLTVAEAFSIADSIANSASKALAEAVSVVDSWTASLKLSEVFSAVDALVKSATEQLAEAFSTVDSKVMKIVKALAEAVSVADSITNSANKALNEAANIVDGKATKVSEALAEAFSVVDSKVTKVYKAFAESVSFVMYNWRKLKCAVLAWIKKDNPITTWIKKG